MNECFKRIMSSVHTRKRRQSLKVVQSPSYTEMTCQLPVRRCGLMNYKNRTQIMLLALVATTLSIALDTPILRQVLGFIFLTFIPGFLILKVLKLGKRNVTDTLVFSVGLSIVFIMSVGLVMNEFYPLVGVSKPLSAIPVTVALVGLEIIFLLVSYRSDLTKGMNVNPLTRNVSKTLIFKSALFILLPTLGIIGALYNNVAMLLFMIVMAAGICAIAVLSHKLLPAELYPIAIFTISLALIFHALLISKYNLGADVNGEYYVFKLTQIQGHWDRPGGVLASTQIANFQSDLSVTILPTIYAVLLNVSGELTFKFVFAFIFSLVPLMLYRIFELQAGKLFAFLSAFVFMSTPFSFYGVEPLSLNRQMVAELFFVLSVFLLIDKSVGLRKRTVLFMIFSFGVVVSHYSTSYIYLLFIVFTFVLSYKYGNGGVLTKEVVLFLCAITFSWYIYISNSAFLGLTSAIGNMITSFSRDLFNPSARSTYAFTMLNPSTSSSIVGLTHRLLVYCQNGLILIGVLMLFIRKRETPFLGEYKYISVLSMFLLIMGLAVPNFAPTLRFERFYQYTLLFLAPFFVFGGLVVIEFIKNLSPHLLSRSGMPMFGKLRSAIPRNLGLQLVTLLMIASFLFQVGLVNRVTGAAPMSNSLDLSRKIESKNLQTLYDLYEIYIPEQDVYSARWYSRSIGQESMVYADVHSRANVLTAYALQNRDRTSDLSNTTAVEHGAFIYLRYFNVRHNTIVTYEGLLNTSDISLLSECDTIYSNGASEILRAP